MRAVCTGRPWRSSEDPRRLRGGSSHPHQMAAYDRAVNTNPPFESLVEALDRRPEILEAYPFGSYARGEAQPHSDVDVAVFIEHTRVSPAPFGYAAALGTDLMAALGRKDVDVVVLNDAPPLLYHRVLRDARPLLSRDLAATTTREGRALSRYCDYLPHLRKIDAALATRIAEGRFGRPGLLDLAAIRVTRAHPGRIHDRARHGRRSPRCASRCRTTDP
jgi:uncharacterized protein